MSKKPLHFSSKQTSMLLKKRNNLSALVKSQPSRLDLFEEALLANQEAAETNSSPEPKNEKP